MDCLFFMHWLWTEALTPEGPPCGERTSTTEMVLINWQHGECGSISGHEKLLAFHELYFDLGRKKGMLTRQPKVDLFSL